MPWWVYAYEADVWEMDEGDSFTFDDEVWECKLEVDGNAAKVADLTWDTTANSGSGGSFTCP